MPPGRAKFRRAHKKSRHGCHTCKRRHTKCDERRPSCVNCETAHLQCSYLETSLPRPSPLTPESATSSLLPTSTTSTVSTPDIHVEATETPAPHQSPYQFPVNMHHMELLGHFLTVTSHSLGDPSGMPTSFLQCILKHAFTTPYLMYEILAIAASHLSQLRPTQQKHYQDASTDLQTQALSLFNIDPLDVHAGNCISKFLFSSFLGIHVFFNTISTSNNDADLLDKFIAYLDIHRGVRAITATSWQMLKETELEPILRAGENNIQPRAEEYRECDRLTALLESSDLSSPHLEECRNALEQLRGLFGAEQCQRDSQDLNFVFAWPVIISGEYTKLLLRRQPEALIILAYYAVLLHARRRVWVIGDAGRALIESITLHLGTYWKQWLAWPNEMLSMHA